MRENKELEIRRLILAKKMFLHGCDHASGKDEINRMFAIHHFDNTVELVLKSAGTKAEIDFSKSDFNQLIGQIFGKYKDLPLKSQLKAQHGWRNQIQHNGNIPSYEDVVRYKNYTMDFFKEACVKIFETPFEKLYLSQLIHNKKLQKKTMAAETAFQKKNFKRCINLSDDIIAHATFDVADIFTKAGMLTGYWNTSKDFITVINDDYPNQYKKEKFFKPVKELSQALLQLGMSATGMQFLDEYRMDFLRFRIIVEKIDELNNEDLEAEAQFSLNFVTNLILKWQEEQILQEI